MANVPEPMSKETLLALLDDMRAHIEAGDSWEGYLEYGFPWNEELGDAETDADGVDFRVRAGYRTGNLQGQGFFRMIGKVGEVE
jgi:hypothetical protein